MEGLIKLGFNWPVLIAQIINFGLLFTLLYFVGYKRFLKMMDERNSRIKESMDQAELVKSQAASAEEELKKQIEEGRKEGQEIINRANRTAEELQLKAQQDAKQEGEALITRARAEIQRERDEALGELRQEFVDLTITAAEKVIEGTLDKEAHRELIDKILEESTPRQG
jgi:F-type H+-transporting ATPase subunit b